MESISFALRETSPASLREIYLQRLTRLQQLRQRHQSELNGSGLRLLDRSVFAAYCDCRDAGAEEEAREVLAGATCDLDPGSVPENETAW